MTKAPNGQDFTAPEAAPVHRYRLWWHILGGLFGVGCLGGPLLLLIAIALSLIFAAKDTAEYVDPVYQLAADKVATEAAVSEALGQPVAVNDPHRSRIIHNDEVTDVCLEFDVTGRDRDGMVYAEAHNRQGAWQLHQLTLLAEGDTEAPAIVPLPVEQRSVCPDFDGSDTDLPAFRDF